MPALLPGSVLRMNRTNVSKLDASGPWGTATLGVVASTSARSAAVARTSMAMPYGPSSRGVGTLRAGNSRYAWRAMTSSRRSMPSPGAVGSVT